MCRPEKCLCAAYMVMYNNRRRIPLDMNQEEVVLCGSSAYTKKYYLNPDFQKIPQGIQDELKLMCVLYTEDVGGTPVSYTHLTCGENMGVRSFFMCMILLHLLCIKKSNCHKKWQKGGTGWSRFWIL